MRDAYLLRSGSRKAALKPAAWGPFVGLLLMRSFDRARTVQEALELRGGVPNRMSNVGHNQSTLLGIIYMVVWGSVFVILMWYEPVRRIGDFVRGAFL